MSEIDANEKDHLSSMEEKIAVAPQGNKSKARRPSAVVVPRRTWLAVLGLAMVSTFLLLALAGVLAVVIVIQSTPPYCAPGLDIVEPNLDKPGPFNDLTPAEMETVRDYLLSLPKLGLVPYEAALVNSSYIFMITLQAHLKATILKFQRGSDLPPRRTAKVVLFRGDQQPPRVEEYLVGPLPKPRYARPLVSPVYSKAPIPFSSRPVDAVERQQLHAFLSVVTEELHTLFMESYKLTYHNCTQNCIRFRDFAPRGTESGERMTWFWAYRATDGFYLHPLGFAIQIDHKDPCDEEWTVSRVIYNGQLFYEIDDLVERYSEGSLRKIQPIMDDIDAQFSTYTRRGHQSFDTPMRGPRLVEPDGHRYSIDGQFVKYFGWNFNMHMHTISGLQIFDVYFQGEKLAYEISLQDITAFYSGYSPETSWLGLYGASWLLGASSFSLVPGLDCPATATFRDSYHFVNTGEPLRYKRSVCIFEHSSGLPLRRHYSQDNNGEFSSYGGLVSNSLVVRTIINVWSCDYIVDYIFHLDGAVELKISLTGYIQASYDLAGSKPYGNRIHDNVRGNLHQHLFHWKIDLDIETTKNRYQTLDMSTESGLSFWFEGLINTTQLTFTPDLKENERQASQNYDFERPRHHILYNRKADNRFDTHRAYEIINDSKSKFLLDGSTITNAASWAKYQIAVTQYKDVEGTSSSIYAQGDPYDPILDFSRFIEDNDTIVDEDLVVWVTSGLYHIPHSEDVPSTSTTTNQCRVFLRPYNFFNHCPSMAVSDALQVKRNDSEENRSSKISFNSFGTDLSEPKCYQKEQSYRDFDGTVETL